jgi:ATP-binding cassette subfamily B protein
MSANWWLSQFSTSRGLQLSDRCRLALGERIAGMINAVPTIEHLETPEYLGEIELLRANRIALSATIRQILLLAQSGLQILGVTILVATIYPPLVFVALLAVVPGVADRHAAQLQKHADDTLAERRRLLDGLFTMATNPPSARELRTFGAVSAEAARHQALRSEVDREAGRVAVRCALWESSGWGLYARRLRGRRCRSRPQSGPRAGVAG